MLRLLPGLSPVEVKVVRPRWLPVVLAGGSGARTVATQNVAAQAAVREAEEAFKTLPMTVLTEMGFASERAT